MNDDEFATRALEHWRAEEPPAGFADRVLAAREHAVSPRRIARWAVAAAIAGLAISAWSFARAHRASTGDQSFASRETVELGKRGRAVAEAGTHLAWSISAAGDARVSQPAGSVFYRIEPGGDFVVGTPAGDVTVTGTCFRVEVTPMASNVVDNKQRAFFALGGAALASAVLVTVYEGRVRLPAESGQGMHELQAGEHAQLASRSFAPFPPTAVTASNPLPAPRPLAAPSQDPAVLLAQNNTQRARIAELEGQVAQLSKARKEDVFPPAPFDQIRGFTPDELKELAKQCQLRMGYPPYGLSPPAFDVDRAAKLNVSPSEREQIDQVLAAQNTTFVQALRALYIEATGDATGADKLDVQAMMQELFAKSRPDESALARQEIARENAGLASPPTDGSKESPITRMYRLLNGAGDQLGTALGSSLGDAEAERVRDELTPMHMSFGGCPGGK